MILFGCQARAAAAVPPNLQGFATLLVMDRMMNMGANVARINWMDAQMHMVRPRINLMSSQTFLATQQAAFLQERMTIMRERHQNEQIWLITRMGAAQNALKVALGLGLVYLQARARWRWVSFSFDTLLSVYQGLRSPDLKLALLAKKPDYKPEELTALLLGGNIDIPKGLTVAINAGNVRMTEALLLSTDLSKHELGHCPPIHTAIKKNNPDLVELVTKHSPAQLTAMMGDPKKGYYISPQNHAKLMATMLKKPEEIERNYRIQELVAGTAPIQGVKDDSFGQRDCTPAQ
jgi:hypothetical protein